MSDMPWVAVKDVCAMYGLQYTSAKNSIHGGTFPVPTYKVGKIWVIDRQVHESYFNHMRQIGLQRLKMPTA